MCMLLDLLPLLLVSYIPLPSPLIGMRKIGINRNSHPTKSELVGIDLDSHKVEFFGLPRARHSSAVVPVVGRLQGRGQRREEDRPRE